MCQTDKMEKVEVRAVIKYFCKKRMSTKEIHEDFMEAIGKVSPYSTVKKWDADFRRGRESIEVDGQSGRIFVLFHCFWLFSFFFLSNYDLSFGTLS